MRLKDSVPAAGTDSCSVQRIQRKCQSPLPRGLSASVPSIYSVRRASSIQSRPVSAQTLGEFGKVYSSFSPDGTFSADLQGRPMSSAGASPMDHQLLTLQRRRQRRHARSANYEERKFLAQQFDEIAATPVVGVLADSAYLSTETDAAVVQLKPHDMRPRVYHRRHLQHPAARFDRSHSLNWSSKRSTTPDEPSIVLSTAVPKSKDALDGIPLGSATSLGSLRSLSSVRSPQNLGSTVVSYGRPGSAMSAVSDASEQINQLLRTRPSSAATPEKAVAYPLRSIVY